MFDPKDILLHWVNRLSLLSRADLSDRFKAAGFKITTEEWALMLVLWQNGPLTPSALAQATFKDRTTVTRLTDGMVRKGMVQRRNDDQDRRRVLIEVTQHGAALRDQLVPIAEAMIADRLSGIPADDLAVTMRTLKTLTHAFETNGADDDRL